MANIRYMNDSFSLLYTWRECMSPINGTSQECTCIDNLFCILVFKGTQSLIDVHSRSSCLLKKLTPSHASFVSSFQTSGSLLHGSFQLLNNNYVVKFLINSFVMKLSSIAILVNSWLVYSQCHLPNKFLPRS